MDNSEKVYDALAEEGADILKRGTLIYPGYYSTCQILIEKRGDFPRVRHDGRGSSVSKNDVLELARLHEKIESLWDGPLY